MASIGDVRVRIRVDTREIDRAARRSARLTRRGRLAGVGTFQRVVLLAATAWLLYVSVMLAEHAGAWPF